MSQPLMMQCMKEMNHSLLHLLQRMKMLMSVEVLLQCQLLTMMVNTIGHLVPKTKLAANCVLNVMKIILLTVLIFLA